MMNTFIQEFTNEKLLYETIGRQYTQLSEECTTLKRKIPLQLTTGGLLMGEVRRGSFVPSPALLDWLQKRTDRKVMVNKKTEWLFLCGRDIFGEGIIKSNAKKGLVLIENEAEEVLGYGDIIGNVKEKKRVVIKNKFDKGDFLRREKH